MGATESISDFYIHFNNDCCSQQAEILEIRRIYEMYNASIFCIQIHLTTKAVALKDQLRDGFCSSVI
jgi:hypothetical protein